MALGFGSCIFKRSEKPNECNSRIGHTLECSATRWELITCFMQHYGNKLSPDAGVRLIEEFCHLVLDNDNPESWQQEINIKGKGNG